MHRLLAICLFALPLLAAAQPGGGPQARSGGSEAQLDAARRAPRSRHEQALQLGAREVKTADGRSFALIWRPAEEPVGWIVTLHGSGSWAADEVVLWQPAAARRKLGVLALQWWFGGDDYYPVPDLRREIDVLTSRAGALPARTLLHGFSRGAANLYALVAMDGHQARPLFRYVLANAGGMSASYPPNQAIEAGRFGTRPYRSTRWWLYCGSGDANPDRDGCPAMRRTRDWLAERGADAELHEDAAGDHGGFHRNARNIDAALDWFVGAGAAAR